MGKKTKKSEATRFIGDVFLKRQRICNLIDKALEKPVITIVAGTGYGKTKSVYNYLQEYKAVTIWMQLSKFDNLPLRLWESFIYALSLQNIKLANDLTEVGFPDSMAAYHRFLSLLSNETKKGRKYVFVYDDFYLIREKAVFDFFDNFIEARIPNPTLIFISRSEPEIDTLALLSKGLLAQITQDDFRFNESETNQYLRLMDTEVAPKAAADIYNYSEGWIFAIHLIALSLQKKAEQESFPIWVVKENINKLLEGELFSHIPEELQKILIELSLLDDIPLVLLQELFPNNNKLIAELGNMESFVRFDAFMQTYRIHHLFLSFLREKQSILKPADVNNIYGKAALWYAKNGFKFDAITLYEKVQDYDSIFSIVMTLPFQFSTEISSFILGMIDRIPQPILDEEPLFMVLYCRIILNQGKIHETFEIITTLIEKYKGFPATAKNNILLCEAHILLGIMESYRCFYTGSMGMVSTYYQKALGYCPDGSVVSKGISMNLSPYISMAGANCNFKTRLKEQRNLAIYYKTLLNGICHGATSLAQGEYLYFCKDTKDAEQYALLSVDEAMESNQFHIENLAHFYLLRIYVSYGSYEKTMERIQILRSRVEKQNQQDAYTMFDIVAGWLYSMIDETDQVAGWIDAADKRVLSSSIFGLDILTRARCYLSQGRYRELLAMIEGQSDSLLNRYLLWQIETTVIKCE